LFGVGESYSGYLDDGPPGLVDGVGYYLVALFVFWILISNVRVARRHVRWVNDMRARDFAWFKATHPGSVTRDGVICPKCACPKIHVRGVMNRSYMRAHACTRCGETLYYSREA